MRTTGGRVVFVDSQTGARDEIDAPNGMSNGLSWIDAGSLVLNQMSLADGRNQLFRQPYPAGPTSRLTNDPNDYVGISLGGDRRDLVTALRNARMDLWVGDGGGTAGAIVIQRVPFSIPRIAWSGDRLLYGGIVGGRPAILRVTPGQGTSEEVVIDALTPDVTSDGRTIVFVSSSTGDSRDAFNLWTADASGRRIRQLVSWVNASSLAIAGRSVRALHLDYGGHGVHLDGAD